VYIALAGKQVPVYAKQTSFPLLAKNLSGLLRGAGIRLRISDSKPFAFVEAAGWANQIPEEGCDCSPVEI